MDVAADYFKLGYVHVIPSGFDHILFILGIFLLNSCIRSVIIQCSVFTLAHSITLGLAASSFILPDPKIVEPLIAASILFVAIENIFRNKVYPSRLAVIFFFGLIHGMGFANAIKGIGLSANHFVGSLLFFNLGVEFGQINVIMAAYFLIAKWLSQKQWYQSRVVYPLSSLIACIALYWTIERLFFAV